MAKLTIAALSLGLAVAGCALGPANPPTVEVQDVRLTGIGALQQLLAVTLCVTNPNDDAIAFHRVSADLDVAGAPLATGVSDLSVRLPPHASTLVPFTVRTTVVNLGPQLLGIVQSGAAEYRVHGTVTLQSLGLTLPYSRAGRLDLLSGGLSLATAANDPAPSRCIAPRA